MRLFSRAGADQIVHEGVTYTRGTDGAFDFPEHVGRVVHGFHVDKTPLWETQVEQQQRLIAEDYARRSDPAQQYDLLERIASKAPAPSGGAQIEALLARVAELEADAKAAAEPEEDEDDQDAEPEAKPAVKRTRKTAQAGG